MKKINNMWVIIVFILLSLTIIFLIAYYVPILICKFRSHRRNIYITISDCKKLISYGYVDSSFFNKIKELKKNDVEVNIVQLAKHCIAGGDLDNVSKSIYFARNNKLDLTIEQILTLDLAKTKIEDYYRDNLKA